MLPSLRFVLFFFGSFLISTFNINYPHMRPFYSNGSMAVLLTLTIALFLLLIILIFHPAEVLRLFHTSTPPQIFLPTRVGKTRLYPRPLSSKTSLLMSNARLFWTSSYVPCNAPPLFPFIMSPTGFPDHSNPVCVQLPSRSVRLFQRSRLCQFSAGLRCRCRRCRPERLRCARSQITG